MWKAVYYRLTWTVTDQRLIAANAGDWLLQLSKRLAAG